MSLVTAGEVTPDSEILDKVTELLLSPTALSLSLLLVLLLLLLVLLILVMLTVLLLDVATTLLLEMEFLGEWGAGDTLTAEEGCICGGGLGPRTVVGQRTGGDGLATRTVVGQRDDGGGELDVRAMVTEMDAGGL